MGEKWLTWAIISCRSLAFFLCHLDRETILRGDQPRLIDFPDQCPNQPTNSSELPCPSGLEEANPFDYHLINDGTAEEMDAMVGLVNKAHWANGSFAVFGFFGNAFKINVSDFYNEDGLILNPNLSTCYQDCADACEASSCGCFAYLSNMTAAFARRREIDSDEEDPYTKSRQIDFDEDALLYVVSDLCFIFSDENCLNDPTARPGSLFDTLVNFGFAHPESDHGPVQYTTAEKFCVNPNLPTPPPPTTPPPPPPLEGKKEITVAFNGLR